MESHFEINVALNGSHLFATAPRSCVSERKARTVYAEIRARFPESEGYSVSVTYWEGYSQSFERKKHGLG